MNKGQRIGVGKINIQWPGLNSPIIQGRTLKKQIRLPDNPNYQSDLVKVRESMGQSRRRKLHPLERGWSGGKLGGQKIGPPDPVGDGIYFILSKSIYVQSSIIIVNFQINLKISKLGFWHANRCL